MAGGPLFPHSAIPVTAAMVFPNVHVGAGANSKHDDQAVLVSHDQLRPVPMADTFEGPISKSLAMEVSDSPDWRRRQMSNTWDSVSRDWPFRAPRLPFPLRSLS